MSFIRCNEIVPIGFLYGGNGRFRRVVSKCVVDFIGVDTIVAYIVAEGGKFRRYTLR
jgi:hypothetical protein